MILLELLSDGLFAAVAGVGFGAISDPPLRAFPRIALLAALGHACRFYLMAYLGVEISLATLVASLLIGFGSLLLGGKTHIPMTVLYVPALLPMVPGKYAYNLIFAQIMYMQSVGDPVARVKYMDMFFSQSMTAVTVVFMLALGAMIPMLLFPKYAFSLTRRHRTLISSWREGKGKEKREQVTPSVDRGEAR